MIQDKLEFFTKRRKMYSDSISHTEAAQRRIVAEARTALYNTLVATDFISQFEWDIRTYDTLRLIIYTDASNLPYIVYYCDTIILEADPYIALRFYKQSPGLPQNVMELYISAGQEAYTYAIDKYDLNINWQGAGFRQYRIGD